MKFKHGTRRRALEYEKDWVQRWRQDKTFEKSVENRPKDNSYVFYDGPPFISGVPHHGTLLSSMVKDAVPRYQTMKGKRVERVWGWDCHGLPAERFTEKKLGINSRQEVIEYGIENYINATRENMVQTSGLWEEYVDRIGRWVDFKGAYKTMDKDYMESIWWAFKTLYEKGKIYEGEKVLMYCTLDGTPLSKAEVTMDAGAYQDVTEPSVYVKFKLIDNVKNSIAIRAVQASDGDRERAFLLSVPRDENGFENPAKPEELENDTAFAGFLKRQIDLSNGVDLPDGYVPSTLYWIEKNDEIVGIGKLRHKLNDKLRHESGGHIGIGGISEKNRGQGIGTRALELLINEAGKIGEKEVLLTVHENNLGSRRMIEKNGGVLEKSIDHTKYEDTKELFYWVNSKNVASNDICLLAWTTTPWTLPANTALAVNKDVNYVEVELDGEHMIVAKDLVEKVFTDEKHQALDYKVVREFKGEELVGLSYEPLFTDRGENAHKIWHADYVETEAGTGIVHIAPTYGEEDFALAQENGFPAVHVIDQNGFFTEGDWIGKNVWETNKQIAKDLKERGVVWKIDYITHSYPHCHRCGTKLMYRAHPSWFVDIADQRTLMLEKNEPINWFPAHVKHGRFEKTVQQAPDWNISRDRFWATAMPVWKGKDNNGNEHVRVVGSYTELKELSGVELDDYHRPWIDDVTFTIGGVEYKRIDKVMDSWFEAGSMPFAQFHYPFENKEKFEANFPGDFIVEYIGQVRAWFYYMHAMSIALFGENSFKNVIVTGNVAGNDGRKMSKSYGNYTDPNELMDKFSADSLRFLLLSSPLLSGEDFALQDKEVGDVARKLSMIWNMYDFFTMYAEVDGWEYDGTLADPLEDLKNPLDRWVVSRMHQLVADVEQRMDDYNLPDALAPVLPFLDDASNWYVRRSRRRFWRSSKGAAGAEDDADKSDAYRTLHYVLVRLAYVLAPFTPFLAEELYHNLTGDDESIHLKDWLPAGHVDQLVVDEMARTRLVIEQGLAARMNKHDGEQQVKVRQPLARLTYPGEPLEKAYEQIIVDEVNVKRVSADNGVKNVVLDKTITAELRREGMVREVVRVVQSARKQADLQIDDRIVLGLRSDDQDLDAAIADHWELIAEETLALGKNTTEHGAEPVFHSDATIDGFSLKISIQTAE